MTIPQDFDIKAELKKCKTADDLTGKNGLLQRLLGGILVCIQIKSFIYKHFYTKDNISL